MLMLQLFQKLGTRASGWLDGNTNCLLLAPDKQNKRLHNFVLEFFAEPRVNISDAKRVSALTNKLSPLFNLSVQELKGA